jgi:hypothetical protein
VIRLAAAAPLMGMRTLCTLTTAIVFMALAAPSALAAKPAKPTVTIALSHSTVTFGNNTTVSGVLSTGAAGVTMTRQSLMYPFSGPFADSASTPSVAGGGYAFTVLGTQTARFQVVAGGKPATTSPVVTLLVRRRLGLRVSDLTPAKGRRVHFIGVSKPADVGAIVSVQRRALVGWKTIATTTLKAATASASTYGVRVAISHSGRYRTVVPGSLGYLAGTSPAKRLTVH